MLAPPYHPTCSLKSQTWLCHAAPSLQPHPKGAAMCAAPRSCARQRHVDVPSYSIPQKQAHSKYSPFSYHSASDKRRGKLPI